MKKIFLTGFYTLSLFALVNFAKAVQIQNPDPNTFASIGQNDVKSVLEFAITTILLPLAGLIAILFIIIGGYQYMTSGINEEQAEQGKKTLQNAIIGLTLIIMSYIVVTVTMNIIKGNA